MTLDPLCVVRVGPSGLLIHFSDIGRLAQFTLVLEPDYRISLVLSMQHYYSSGGSVTGPSAHGHKSQKLAAWVRALRAEGVE
jgi:hypothetical protein